MPDLRGLVLDPTRLREMLRKLAVLSAQRGAVQAHHERRSASRTLIDCENVPSHAARAYQRLHSPSGITKRVGRGARRGPESAQAAHKGRVARVGGVTVAPTWQCPSAMALV